MADRLTQSQFAAHFKSCSQRLWCIASAVIGDRSLADDALQEAAIVGLRKLQDFQPGTSFGAWMGQIVRNVSRNIARQRNRGPGPVGDECILESAGASSLDTGRGPVTAAGRLVGDQRCFDDRIVAALGTLGETARACLLLRVVLDAPYEEIAEILQIPTGTAMSHVHRARHELRRRLAPAAGMRPGHISSTS